MQIEIQIDINQQEPKLIILTDRITEEIEELVKKVNDCNSKIIAGFLNDKLEIIEPATIIRAYSENKKVLIATLKGVYMIRLRLYELEERLDTSIFTRISNSEIINLRMVTNFDLSFTGTICVKFHDGSISYVSRRYVPKIKQILGI